MERFDAGDIVRVPLPYTDRSTLPAPSAVRPCKLATIEAKLARRRGRIRPDLMTQVAEALRRYLGFH